MKEQCESFYTQFQTLVHSAIGAALSVKTGKAKKLIDELHSQCLKVFKDKYLAMHLAPDSDGYDDCDNEDEDVFRANRFSSFNILLLTVVGPLIGSLIGRKS